MAFSVTVFSQVFDYVVFILVLLVSLFIGVYFSCRQKTSEEYVHGNHRLGLLPASVSMVVSYVSALTLQGIPAEIYMFGIQYTVNIVAALGMPLMIITFLPILYHLKPTSVFEYLDQRYGSNKPKLLGVWLSIITGLLYAGITCYGPAAAIESLTGVPTVYNIIIMTIICMIYTTIGGIKAVIWTDVFQAAIMVLGMMAVIIVGGANINTSSMWEDMHKYGKTRLILDTSLTQRSSVWIFLFGSAIHRFTMFLSQPAVVRFTSLSTYEKAKWSILIASLGYGILMLMAYTVGIIVLVYYSQKGCGPIESGQIYSSNQVVPYFVVTVLNYPGVPGLFISATVASTLSSISSAQNAIGTIVWKDLLSKLLNTSTEFLKTLMLKLTVLICSIIAMGVSFVAMYAGGTLIFATAVALGVFASPPVGMFILGALFPFVSSISAVVGCVCSLLFCGWLSLGGVFYGTIWEGPTLIEDMCYMHNDSNFNITTFESSTIMYPIFNTTTNSSTCNGGLCQLYSLSPFTYPFIGTGTTIMVGLLLSLVPCLRHKESVDNKLLFPFVRKFVKTHGVNEHALTFTEQNESLMNQQDA